MLILKQFTTLVATTCIELLVQSVNAALPDPRWGHAAVLLRNNLYIYGGKVGLTREADLNDTSQNSNQLLMLNVSDSFSVSDPGWMTRFVGPNVAYHTLSIGGSQNELLVLYGGEYANSTDEQILENPLFYYNTLNSSSVWDNAGLSLGTPRMSHTAVTKLDKSINYFFGGIPNVSNSLISSQVQFQDLFKLDTKNNLWSLQATDPNTPSGRFHHTATILSDGKMYVIGGYSKDELVDMSQIYVYDTINAKWDVQTAGGKLPTARRAHVAVGTHDGKVIIHGGVNINYNVLYGDVAVLDTTQSQFVWSLKETKGAVPPARYSHTATMVGTNMLIAFGYLANDVSDNNIYVLDTTTFTWKENYTPNNLDYTNTIPHSGVSQEPSSSKAGTIAGSVIGVISFFLLIGGLFLFYRRRKRNAFYAAPYSSTGEQPSNQDKSKKFSISSGSTAVEELPRLSMAGTSENGAHGKDYTTILEERMMDSDVQQSNFLIVPKSTLRVTNPDNN
ncbi:galactose oxidase [Rhizophagus irregularis]|uniref:Galactose oxidase n=1 Tax=Rhizophagus irregularis TaxID=588596 RepID=A0A2I1EUR5_9GLOM|nr:galactose oxidase [Rhizophagus irregularis]PKC69651.1 galactose oxidase [Rhizophagus irregularis]PKY25873.1 galactose oxidase [Rhizophagus irregularis]CAB5112211.1 unnamed protein product [Rhizophagus irregularis]CAB5369510.1 unnamed protein product [Rhizophagus irregularis]